MPVSNFLKQTRIFRCLTSYYRKNGILDKDLNNIQEKVDSLQTLNQYSFQFQALTASTSIYLFIYIYLHLKQKQKIGKNLPLNFALSAIPISLQNIRIRQLEFVTSVQFYFDIIVKSYFLSANLSYYLKNLIVLSLKN